MKDLEVILKDNNGREVGKVNTSEIQEYLSSILRSQDVSDYGYDVYLLKIIRLFLGEKQLRNPDYCMKQVSPFFQEAAWQLCLRGILRPGIQNSDGQITEQGSDSMGFSFTLFGEKWKSEEDDQDFFPTDFGNYGELINQFVDLYGEGFLQRANEALRCYLSHAYFACCAMTGAAAESIALYLAIQIQGSEEEIMKKYESPGGRTEILKIVGENQKPKNLRSLEAYFELLSDWRDAASHGSKVEVNSNDAYTAILLLIRFARFVEKNLDEIVAKK